MLYGSGSPAVNDGRQIHEADMPNPFANFSGQNVGTA